MRSLAGATLALLALLSCPEKASARNGWRASRKAAAQAKFDAGLIQLYAFDQEAASGSFAQALAVDPHCAMCRWGAAMALAPTINSLPDEENTRRATSFLDSIAIQALPPTEAALVAAAKVRFLQGDSAAHRTARYAEAMSAAASRFPDSDEVLVWHAEAQISQAPWRLWDAGGNLIPIAADAAAALETVLRRNPRHVGANHLYVHVFEGSNQPARALASALRLPVLAPESPHLVHMPSHILLRLGRYEEAASWNRRAIRLGERMKFGSLGPNQQMYALHNFAFLTAAAAWEGRHDEAVAAARHVADAATRAPHATCGNDWGLTSLWFTYARFSDWQALLSAPAPRNPSGVVAFTWNALRAVAEARNGEMGKAEAHALEGRRIAATLQRTDWLGMANEVGPYLDVLSGFENAVLADARSELVAATSALEQAALADEKVRYDEPAVLPLPVHEMLGSLYLKTRRLGDAEREFRRELDLHPNSPWALAGLRATLAELKQPVANFESESPLALNSAGTTSLKLLF